jgi:hypothetical protein
MTHGTVDKGYFLTKPARIVAMGCEQVQELDDTYKIICYRNDTALERQCTQLENLWLATKPA